ncbi:MAG: RluA family pseudouridine synthase [Actinobacteria bacterium]|nr:RluA family pseudouridine synthase [Actinomycetota bacterium]
MPSDQSESDKSSGLNESAEDESTLIKIEVRESLTGRRLDKYLHGRLGRFSRTAVQRLIKNGEVHVDGKAVKCSYEIHGGEIIEAVVPPAEPTEIQGEDIPLDIIFEDEHLIGLNKQAGIVVHPARGIGSGTLVNGLVYYAESLSSSGGKFRPGVVHRLDKDTTGIMLVAKNDEAHWRLAQQFEHRQVEKTYLAVVEGQMELLGDLIDHPIGMHPVFRDRCAVRQTGGRQAQTFYEVTETFRGYSLLTLKPRTGRTHQLRVHMSYLKHPLVADRNYGGKLVSLADISGEHSPNSSPIIERQALHAWKIQFRHPITGEQVQLEAPWPSDFENLLEALRKYRSLG